MKPYLLDVNALVALLWSTHIHYRPARALKVLSNPSRSVDAVPVGEALQMLDALLALPEHSFWPDLLAMRQVFDEVGPLTGHQQITDGYLLAVARANNSILATFDRGVASLPGAKGFVELISPK